jgi:hypothetical protein
MNGLYLFIRVGFVEGQWYRHRASIGVTSICCAKLLHIVISISKGEICASFFPYLWLWLSDSQRCKYYLRMRYIRHPDSHNFQLDYCRCARIVLSSSFVMSTSFRLIWTLSSLPQEYEETRTPLKLLLYSIASLYMAVDRLTRHKSLFFLCNPHGGEWFNLNGILDVKPNLRNIYVHASHC